jgi:hypothetical protein
VATENQATVLFPNAEVGNIFRFGRVIALHSVLVAALFAGAVSAATLPVVHVWENRSSPSHRLAPGQTNIQRSPYGWIL